MTQELFIFLIAITLLVIGSFGYKKYKDTGGIFDFLSFASIIVGALILATVLAAICIQYAGTLPPSFPQLRNQNHVSKS